VAFVYWRDTGLDPSFGKAGLVVWDDPLNSPDDGDVDLGFLTSDGSGYAAASIDAIDWEDPVGSTNVDFDAVVVDTAFAIFAIPDGVRTINVEARVVTVAPTVLASGNTTTPRRFYGLAVNSNTGFAWMDFSSGWRIRQSISGSTTTQFTFDATAFPATTRMFGIRVAPAMFAHRNTLNLPANFVYSTGGSVVRGRADFTTTLISGSGAPNGQPFSERGVNSFGWVDDEQQNRIWESNTFGLAPQTFRFPINKNRPIHATGRTTEGSPTVVFHTGGTGFTTGVVVGYRDGAGCFND